MSGVCFCATKIYHGGTEATELQRDFLKLSIYFANNNLIIDANTNEKLNANFYNVNGRQVLSKIISDKSIIDVSDIDEGYTLTMADRIVNKKLVIVRR